MTRRTAGTIDYADVLEVAGAWLLAILWISPLLYAFWAAFHASQYATHFDLFAPLSLENFREALSQAPFFRYGLNTFILVTTLLAAQLIVATLAAYAFARYQFFGSNIAFSLVLVQLMVTPEILIVQNYGTLSQLNMVDTIAGIGLPYVASAFGIFLLRQAFKSTPKELEEAAFIDGAGRLRTYAQIVMPLARPALLTVGLITFMGSWNSLLWPLIIAQSEEMQTLPLGLARLALSGGWVRVEWGPLMAATLLSILPIMLIYVFLQSYFIRGIALSGLK